MKFVNAIGENTIDVHLPGDIQIRALTVLPENQFPIGHIRKIGFGNALGVCSGINFYKRGLLTGKPRYYLQTDTGAIIAGYSFPAPVPVLALAAVAVIALSGLPEGSLPTDTQIPVGNSSGFSQEVSNEENYPENSAEGGENNNSSDIQTGTLPAGNKPPVDYGAVKPGSPSVNSKPGADPEFVNKMIPLSWNLTPSFSEGKLRVRFQPEKESDVKCVFKILVNGEEVYDSGVIKSGQFIEYATLPEGSLSSGDKANYLVEMLTESNAVYSEIKLPVDKITFK